MTEEQVFLAALDLADAADRNAFVRKACGGDVEFRRQVADLLAAHFKTGEFLDEPFAKQMAAGLSTPTNENTLSAGANLGEHDVAKEKKPDEEPDDLHFLQPSTGPDSLGRIGHYEVLEILGRGGFGIVFRALDELLQRVVALKVLAPAIAATSPARRRFLREARASAKIRHENAIQVYDVEEQPLPYLVMEFIPGETLQQRIDRIGPLEASEIVRIGRQIAEGLAAAHATGLIHRDIKPGNVLIETGTHERVRITDFGLARAADDASLTQSGVLAGTPMYMAPEQAKGESLDPRADLFSLGSVMYVMASGRPPFRAATTFAVLKRVVEEEPRSIRDVIPEVPQWLCEIIARLQAKKPEDRFQSAREVADVLADCEAKYKAQQEVKSILPAPAAKPAAPTASTGRTLWLAAAALLLPLIALAVTEFAGVTHLFRGREPTPDPIKPNSAPTPVPVARREPLPPPFKNSIAKPSADASAWERSVAALPAADQVQAVGNRLKELNPGFDGQVKSTIKDEVVTGLQFLTDEVDDIAPVRALKGLTSLDCRGTFLRKGKLSALAPLKGIPLTSLNLADTQVRDLERLKGMPLTSLNIIHSRVGDLEPIKGMPLTWLNIGVTEVLDLSPLKGMSLTTLQIDGLLVRDLGPLKGMPLTTLTGHDCREIRDLSPLKGMPLSVLYLWAATQVRDLEPLKDMPLTSLTIGHSQVEDLEPLKGMPLTTLNLTNCARVRDLKPLKDMPLKTLIVLDTGVTDLKPLQGMPLEDIRVTPKNITQGLDVLRDLKRLKTIGIDHREQVWPAAEFWDRYDKGEFK